jgi:hypothetical protein
MILRTWVCLIMIGLSGCSLEIQTVSRPDWQNLRPRARDCHLVVYPIDQKLDPSCKEIGDVFVGDTGWTTDCEWNRVIDTVRSQACLFGADAAQLVHHHEPSFWGSTCHQVRARFLACQAEERHAE